MDKDGHYDRLTFITEGHAGLSLLCQECKYKIYGNCHGGIFIQQDAKNLFEVCCAANDFRVKVWEGAGKKQQNHNFHVIRCERERQLIIRHMDMKNLRKKQQFYIALLNNFVESAKVR